MQGIRLAGVSDRLLPTPRQRRQQALHHAYDHVCVCCPRGVFSCCLQSTWQVSDDMNASVQHSVDPVVRSSLGKAGMMVANALTSPRRVSCEFLRQKPCMPPHTGRGRASGIASWVASVFHCDPHLFFVAVGVRLFFPVFCCYPTPKDVGSENH